MEYRTDSRTLLETLKTWDGLLPGRGKIRLIACGGTALTLMGYKESTKDVDFLVPEKKEYQRLIAFLQDAGYRRITTYGWKRENDFLIFDLYPGNRVYTTELLDSPLKQGGHLKIREWDKIYLGVLNAVDLIVSKMFRGDEIDIQDSLLLLSKKSIAFKKLEKRYHETAKYDVGEENILRKFERLKKRFEKGNKDHGK